LASNKNKDQDTTSQCEEFPSSVISRHIFITIHTKEEVIDEDEIVRESTEELMDPLNSSAAEGEKSSYVSLRDMGLCTTVFETPTSIQPISDEQLNLPIEDFEDFCEEIVHGTEPRTSELHTLRAATTPGCIFNETLCSTPAALYDGHHHWETAI